MEWELVADQMTIHAIVPAGVTAQVELPGSPRFSAGAAIHDWSVPIHVVEVNNPVG